ncbi:MAG: glycosyltransferase [Planctomycetota bacterium]
MSFARVLVVSSSAGHGHVMAAHAISDALRRRHPTIDVSQVDALRKMGRWYGLTYRWGYLAMADRAPIAWRALYAATDRKKSWGGHLLTRLAGRALLDACLRWRPHVVLSTHFLGPEVLARAVRKGKLDTRLELVVTDHDVHRMWYWPEVTRYYVASDLVRARLNLRYGVPDPNILVTGIPVRRPFTARQDLAVIRAKLGLDPARPVVLFMSGGFSSGPMRQAILGLWMERRDVQVIAVCGRNVRLRRAIERLPRPGGAVLHATGFITEPWEMIAVSDLVVTKAGGITTAECLAIGRPLVLSAWIPGQEERNADALVEAGAAVKAPTPEEIRWRIAGLLADRAKLRAMTRAARTFGRPGAANAIADAVADEIQRPAPRGPRFHGAY